MKRRIWLPMAAAYLLLRWVLVAHPGYVVDVNAYKRWALRAAENGIAQVYATSDMDYPPLYAWILYPLGKVAQAIDPEGAAAMRDARHLTVLVKLPPLIFDLAVAWLLWRLGRHRARERPKEPRWDILLPAVYLLNPAVVFDTGYWGQPDSVHSFFVLAAFLLLGAPEAFWRRVDAWPAWVCLTLGTLMKPLGAPFFPLLLLLSLWRRGARATLLGIGAAAATTAVVFLPFALAGELGSVLQRVAGDVQLMPNTSSNAHNLWWIYGAWKPANQPAIGPLTLTQIGLLLFALILAALLRRAWLGHRGQRGPTGAQGLLLALGIALAFFHLSTHLHENHMFLALPLAIALLPFAPPRDRALRWLVAGLSAGLFLNLITHDLALVRHPPFNLGGPTAVMNLHLKRPFHAGELALIWIGVALNALLFSWVLWRTLGPAGRSWFGMLGEGGSTASRRERARSAAG
jgi:Gpi18-like mannosyltransferase